jgi:fructosamine-3-kinase
MWSELPLGDELRAEFGPPRRVQKLRSSPRSHVWSIDRTGASVIVKQLVEGPNAVDRFSRELAALRLAARANPPVAPRLLAADPDRRVLVLEQLIHRDPTPDWVIDYAVALARLHTVAGPKDTGTLPRWSGPTLQDGKSFLRLAGDLGVSTPDRLSAELTDLVHRLDQIDDYALLHGDPCPGNDIHTKAGIHFIDFEQASLGNAITELAYLRIGFPTCLCVIAPSESVLARAETAYRNEWRSLSGADVCGSLADACAGWLIRGDALVARAYRETVDHLARLPHEDWTWGTATARERLLHRLTVLARVSVDHAGLSALSQCCNSMRDRILAKWSALKPLPAFRPSR